MGVAEYQEDSDPEEFIHLVDERMYKEKQESKELSQFRLEVDLGKDNYYIRCLNCGLLVHWASSICENCLGDPRKKAAERNPKITTDLLREPSRSTNDRRKTPRIRLKKAFMHDGLQATIQNISQEGIQIRTRTALAVGDTITIALVLENTILRLNGSVVYIRHLSDGYSLVGLQFLDLSEENSHTLNRLIKSCSVKTPQIESLE